MHGPLCRVGGDSCTACLSHLIRYIQCMHSQKLTNWRKHKSQKRAHPQRSCSRTVVLLCGEQIYHISISEEEDLCESLVLSVFLLTWEPREESSSCKLLLKGMVKLVDCQKCVYNYFTLLFSENLI